MRKICRFLAGIHDVGKITRSFQRKIPPGANAEMILGSLEDVGLDLEFGIDGVLIQATSKRRVSQDEVEVLKRRG